jgi:hypothetical protein
MYTAFFFLQIGFSNLDDEITEELMSDFKEYVVEKQGEDGWEDVMEDLKLNLENASRGRLHSENERVKMSTRELESELYDTAQIMLWG